MTTLTPSTFPKIRDWQLRMLLQDAILLNQGTSFYAEIYREAARTDITQCGKDIWEQYGDNPGLVTEIMGEKVIRLLKQLYHT